MVVIDQKFIFQEVEEKSLKFLRERGHINPTRVNFIDFSNLYFGSGFKSGEEINNFPEIKAIKNNRYLISGVIIVFISLVILGFVLYKMHRKRRYFSYGY